MSRLTATRWSTPTRSEAALVLKVGLAAGVSYSIARLVTGVPNPVLAPAAAIVTVHATVWSSLREALQRSISVVVGVVVALVIADVVGLNGLSVALLVAASLGVSLLVLRFTGGAANQMPITVLLVLAVVGSGQKTYGLGRAVDTVIGAAVGALIPLLLPASRWREAHDALARVVTDTSATLAAMSDGVRTTWSVEQTARWRRRAQSSRNVAAPRAMEAVDSGGRAARWNHRDQRRQGELARYEAFAPRLARVTVSVSEIARDLDRIVSRTGGEHASMPRMSALLEALADAVRTSGALLDGAPVVEMRAVLDALQERRADCERGALRRARLAAGSTHDRADPGADEWLEYGDILLQVDRVERDLTHSAAV